VIPVLEKVSKLSLNAISLEVSTSDAYTKNGVPVTVDSIVIMKIGGDDASISNAAERFLGLRQEEIKKIAQEVLSGHLRAICSTLTPEEINKERQQFQQKVLDVSHDDFSAMGLYIDSFTVKQIRDEHGYLEALGKASTANVKRDALIGEAEALQKEAVQKTTDAQKEGAVRKAENEAMISNANKERDVKIAKYTAEVAKEQATAAQAGPKSTAIATQEVVEAETGLAEKRAVRTESELKSTKIKPAEAEKQSLIINAEGAKQKQILEAEAKKVEKENEGLGEASKTRAIGEADGAALAAKGKGEGEATRAKLIAEADGIRAKLLAEAEGLDKKADALKKYSDASKDLQISLELIKILPILVEKAAAPITAIKDIKILDFGGSNANGDGSSAPLDKILKVTPQTLAVMDETLRSTIGMGMADMIGLVRSGKAKDVIKTIEEGPKEGPNPVPEKVKESNPKK
jgi:flotillin